MLIVADNFDVVNPRGMIRTQERTRESGFGRNLTINVKCCVVAREK